MYGCKSIPLLIGSEAGPDKALASLRASKFLEAFLLSLPAPAPGLQSRSSILEAGSRSGKWSVPNPRFSHCSLR